MNEELLGYLLGALEPDEVAAVEARLAVDAEWQRELETLRLLLAPLATDREYFDPPSRLADRVCKFIAGVGRRGATIPATPLPASAGATWSRVDAATIVGLFLAALVLFVPVLVSNRYRAQALACRERLHEVGLALVNYSRAHDRLFPEVPVEGNLAHAGVYAVRLQEARYLADERIVYCPTSADENHTLPRVPSLTTLHAADSADAADLFARMDGAFGYALGYVEGGRYFAVRNRDRARFAVLADSPDEHGGGSRNHGCGQNVWFEDGHAEFLNCRRLNACNDDLYENDEGYVGAGIGPDDVVIGAAQAQPRLIPVAPEE